MQIRRKTQVVMDENSPINHVDVVERKISLIHMVMIIPFHKPQQMMEALIQGTTV
jgi:hypothetical protein